MANKLIDISGQTFYEWTVKEYSGKKNKRQYWKCVCSCGNTKDVDGADLKRGKTKSCGHDKRIDLTGKVFGEWEVVRSSRIDPDNDFKHYWICKCSCGNIREIAHGNLANGTSTNCGHVNRVYEDLSIGDIFNEWTIIGNYIRKNKSKYYFCRCSCGKEKYIEYKTLLNETSTNCGHLNNDGIISGMIFGRLKIIEFSHRDKNGISWYSCQCSCGNTKIINGSALKFGNTSSCGCYGKESASKRIIEYLEKNKDTNKFGYKWYFYDKNKNKVKCRSSYEVFFWNYYCHIKKENIEYEPKTFVLEHNSRYTPDFYFPDINKWIETKGSFYTYSAGEKQKSKIEIMKKTIDIDVLFWKNIVQNCQLKYKALVSYFNNAKKNNIPIEDYLANMMYIDGFNYGDIS